MFWCFCNHQPSRHVRNPEDREKPLKQLQQHKSNYWTERASEKVRVCSSERIYEFDGSESVRTDANSKRTDVIDSAVLHCAACATIKFAKNTNFLVRSQLDGNITALEHGGRRLWEHKARSICYHSLWHKLETHYSMAISISPCHSHIWTYMFLSESASEGVMCSVLCADTHCKHLQFAVRTRLIKAGISLA